MNWEEKLTKFLNAFEHKDDLIGVLVCGSYITGNPTCHSDLDVHLILNEKVDYRERGNRYVDGLLIEYFANTPNQIRSYFKRDYEDMKPMCQVQFITGKIIFDDTGEVLKLKETAEEMLKRNFSDIDVSIDELKKYSIWDMLDDLQDMYENNREDFDLVYYINLDTLLNTYMRLNRMPYNKKTILGNIKSEIVRSKYLLKEIPDVNVRELIIKCITNKDKKIRLENYEKITKIVLEMVDGFDVSKFTFKSNKHFE